jgi:hypothetical protein
VNRVPDGLLLEDAGGEARRTQLEGRRVRRRGGGHKVENVGAAGERVKMGPKRLHDTGLAWKEEEKAFCYRFFGFQ